MVRGYFAVLGVARDVYMMMSDLGRLAFITGCMIWKVLWNCGFEN